MRKLSVFLLVFSFLFCLNSMAAELELLPGTAAVNNGFTLNADGSTDGMNEGESIVFSSVTVPKNTKTVVFTLGCQDNYYSDGDVLQMRKGDPNGELLAEFVIGITGSKNDKIECKSAFLGKPGTYDIAIKSMCGKNYVKLWSISFSTEKYVPETYVKTPENKISDLGATTWAAVDGVGRGMPTFADAGEKKDKTVGIFYWTWHDRDPGAVYDNTRILKENPGSDADYPNSVWGPYHSTHHWGEPLFGYYIGDDRWVLRRHISMLSAAGVDVLITDCTNGNILWKEVLTALLDEMHAMREEGLATPQVALICNFAPVANTRTTLYNFYKSTVGVKKYEDLLFMWKGKPLVMAYPGALEVETGDPIYDAELKEIREYFTFREPQANYTGGGSGTQWGWLEMYPQTLYNVQDGVVEEMTVGVAQNQDYFLGYIAPMNTKFCTGRSYTHTWGMDYSEGAYRYGYNFREQWMRVHEIQPEFVFVTGFNEWTAGFHPEWQGQKNAFPDQYDTENSRDIEPVKGALGDDYYYQLILNVRRFKGVDKTPLAGKEITVKSMADAKKAEPAFTDVSGDTIHRNHPSSDKNIIYVDTTGRNDIVEARVARDKDNLYFYVKCKENITSPDNSAWMRLYINADRIKVTGWEGYDFMIDGGMLYAFTSEGFETKEIKAVPIKRNGKEMYYTVSRTDLGVGEVVDLEFKWTDNTQVDGDVLDWYVSGDSAPLGRFNYVYTQKADKALSADDREKMQDILAVKENTSVVYVHGARRVYVDKDPRITAISENGVLYIPSDILPDYLNCKLDLHAEKKQLVIMGQKKTLRLIEDAKEMFVDGKKQETDSTIIIKDGVCYVSVKALSDGLRIPTAKDEEHGVILLGTAKNVPVSLDFVY